MKILLDTHAFLWGVAGLPLGREATQAFLDTRNELFFSAASYWEIGVKISIGKLVLREGWQDEFEAFIQINHIQWLPIEKQHIWRMIQLPFHHRDPFDRLLISQALAENMAIMSHDVHFSAYAAPIIW